MLLPPIFPRDRVIGGYRVITVLSAAKALINSALIRVLAVPRSRLYDVHRRNEEIERCRWRRSPPPPPPAMGGAVGGVGARPKSGVSTCPGTVLLTSSGPVVMPMSLQTLAAAAIARERWSPSG